MGNGPPPCQPTSSHLLIRKADRYSAGMTKADDERAKRLAQALRTNLRRRKAQARGDDPKAPEGDDGKAEQPRDGA